jgi:methanogenic corrinoid protein MtbC1
MTNTFLLSVAEDPSPIASEAFRRLANDVGAAGGGWDSRQAALVADDLAHHVRHVASAAAMDDEKSLADYAAWVEVLCATLGFRQKSMAAAMRCLQQSALSAAEMPPPAGYGASECDAALLAGWFAKAAEMLDRPLGESANPYLKTELHSNPSASLFLNALLEGKRDFALSIVNSDKVQGFGLEKMYERIFAPSQRELGRLWHLGKISVAQEHFVTAATQVILSSLYEDFFKSQAGTGIERGLPASAKPKMIAACAQGELHEMGIRMIADTFCSRGWDTIFLGANLPEWELIKEIKRIRPDFLSLSATIFPHVAWMERTIREIQRMDAPPKIIVGGRLFVISANLWRTVGADADCEGALAAAESLRATA